MANVLDIAKEIRRSASDQIWIMTNQALKIRGSKTIRLGRYIIPEELTSLGGSIASLYTQMESKIVRKIYHAIIIGDMERGIIVFPNLEGIVDFNYAFDVGKESISFLINIYNYYWEQGVTPKK